MLNISPISAFSDNYIWLLYDEDSREAFVVDPGDAAPVEAALKEMQLSLTGILITHHHWDHTGGIDELLNAYPNIPVYGPTNEKITQINNRLVDTQTILLDMFDLTLSVMTVPGHTLDHIAYYWSNTEHATQPSGILIAGDTIFAGGCGRMFEGTPEMFLQSLNKITQLPDDTVLYCSHEYTLANLAFAQAVEPNNSDITQRLIRERHKREQQIPTLPSSIGLELATNPFVRCQQPAVINSANSKSGQTQTTPADVFAVLRAWKNDFPVN